MKRLLLALALLATVTGTARAQNNQAVTITNYTVTLVSVTNATATTIAPYRPGRVFIHVINTTTNEVIIGQTTVASNLVGKVLTAYGGDWDPSPWKYLGVVTGKSANTNATSTVTVVEGTGP